LSAGEFTVSEYHDSQLLSIKTLPKVDGRNLAFEAAFLGVSF